MAFHIGCSLESPGSLQTSKPYLPRFWFGWCEAWPRHGDFGKPPGESNAQPGNDWRWIFFPSPFFCLLFGYFFKIHVQICKPQPKFERPLIDIFVFLINEVAWYNSGTKNEETWVILLCMSLSNQGWWIACQDCWVCFFFIAFKIRAWIGKPAKEWN